MHGLRTILSRPRAILWTYFFNVLFAFAFSIRFDAQMHGILSHSLASQRLTSAFDLGVAGSALERLNRAAPATGVSGYIGIFLYLLTYFLIVPGTLFCYQTAAPGRLAILLSIGFQRFWRFFRILLLTLLVSAMVLGPLIALQGMWSRHVAETTVGMPAFYKNLAGWIVVALVAAVIRLYFDLVEVYTLALGEQFRANGRPDRRVRRVLLPALRALRDNFGRAYAVFLLLTVAGLLGMYATGQLALQMLAQPRVWPMFLLVQAGVLWMLFTRFWQRGAETVLCQDYPLPVPDHMQPQPLDRFSSASGAVPPLAFNSRPIAPPQPISGTTRDGSSSLSELRPDPLPNPEPAPPSLDTPDPGVFHHDPNRPNDR